MRRTTTATLAAGLLLALTACSSGGDTGSSKPAATTTSASPSSTTKAYTYQDCVDLLEYDYGQGTPKDASGDPECSHLTSDEYAKAVGEVLTGHKGDFLEQGAREIVWDNAWDGLTPDKQTAVCDQIAKDGVDAVGQQLKASGAKPAGYEVEMAQYYQDNKC